MSDDQKTAGKPRLVGHMRDATGRSLAVSADQDTVIFRWAGQDIRLSHAERDPFMRLFMTAERQAEAWRPPGEDCTTEAVLPSGRLPCTLPRGHEGKHLYSPAT